MSALTIRRFPAVCCILSVLAVVALLCPALLLPSRPPRRSRTFRPKRKRSSTAQPIPLCGSICRRASITRRVNAGTDKPRAELTSAAPKRPKPACVEASTGNERAGHRDPIGGHRRLALLLHRLRSKPEGQGPAPTTDDDPERRLTPDTALSPKGTPSVLSRRRARVGYGPVSSSPPRARSPGPCHHIIPPARCTTAPVTGGTVRPNTAVACPRLRRRRRVPSRTTEKRAPREAYRRAPL
jgi:hypothetical protein